MGWIANYVHNKIICTKEVLNKYFIDYYPFNDEDKLNKPYITFNNIFNVKSINEYSPNIYYGYGFTYDKIEDDKYEIKFFTRWLYPIEAILKVISLCKNDITWYACEGNMNIVSKFYYKNKKVYEDVLDLSNTDFEDWYKNNIESGKIKYEYPNSSIWIYKPEEKKGWKKLDIKDLKKKYINKYPENLSGNIR